MSAATDRARWLAGYLFTTVALALLLSPFMSGASPIVRVLAGLIIGGGPAVAVSLIGFFSLEIPIIAAWTTIVALVFWLMTSASC